MQLLEYQAKALLREAGLAVPDGVLVSRGEAVPEVVLPVVVKSQVPVGGRGKLGGVTLAKNQNELDEAVATILQLDIKGFRPDQVLIEPALEIERELYLAIQVNRDKRRVEYIASQDGGVNIEDSPENVAIFPDSPDVHELVAKTLHIDELEVKKFCQRLEMVFADNDCLLVEVNPLVVTKSGALYCADAKIQIDDNARFRQENLPWSNIPSLKKLGGNIGVLANGAGMAMSTMDAIYEAGGSPANFLDIGGGTGEDTVVQCLGEISDLPGLDSIIINIFAGITRCDDIARGIVAAKQRIANLPRLFVRLDGTNRAEAEQILKEHQIKLQPSLEACIAGALGYSAKPSSRKNVSKNQSKIVKSNDNSVDVGVWQEIFSKNKVIVQGITGRHGSFHTAQMLESGTDIVAGVTPGRSGQTVHGVPVFDSVVDAVSATKVTASVVFVPAQFAKTAMYEAIDAGIQLIVCITEGIPVHDMLAVRQRAAESGVLIIGPNCPGFIVPGVQKLGIISDKITKPGGVTIISRSGTLTYELSNALSQSGIGQRLILGIGGDMVSGMSFVEALQVAQMDDQTESIVVIGEIGGESENLAADYVKQYIAKPVYGLVVGHSLPVGQTFGHAGAIASRRGETAAAKTEYMESCGILMNTTLDDLRGQLIHDLHK